MTVLRDRNGSTKAVAPKMCRATATSAYLNQEPRSLEQARADRYIGRLERLAEHLDTLAVNADNAVEWAGQPADRARKQFRDDAAAIRWALGRLGE